MKNNATRDFAIEMGILEQDYIDFIAKLGQLSSDGLMHLDKRKQKLNGSPCIPLYVLFWYADVFGVQDSFVVKEISSAHYYLYYSIILRDDAHDLENVPARRYAALSDLTLSKSLELFTGLDIDQRYFWEKVRNYLKETVEAEEFLERHRNRISQYNDLDFISMGRKGALMKISAAVYADLSNKREVLRPIEQTTDLAATVLQIMDDYIDWKEDFRRAKFTYPLSFAIQNLLGVKPGTSFEYNNDLVPLLHEQLFGDGVAKTIVSKAADYMKQSRHIITKTDAPYLLSFIDYALDQYQNIIEEIHKPRKPGLASYIERFIRPRAQQT